MGAVEQRASAPGAVVFYLEPLVVLIMAQFVFAVYSRLQPRYIPPQRRRSWSGGQETRNVRCLRPARPCFSVYCMCMLSTSFARISVVFAGYMALVEPRNGGTKTLCKRLSLGKQEIMIFIDNVPPPFIRRVPRKSWAEHFLHVFTWQLHLQ